MGRPIGLQLHKGGQNLQKVLLGQLGQAQALGGIHHALGVAIRPEELHAAVRAAVGLQALKDLAAVVQAGGGGMQGQVAKGHDARVVPALSGVPVDQGHMIGKDFAKAQGGFIGGLGLGGGGLFNADVQHAGSPSFIVLQNHGPCAGP